MERRRILIIAASVLAIVGATLVFLYARNADARAEERFKTTTVLVVSSTITPGESLSSAVDLGKITAKPVANDSLLEGYQTETATLADLAALTTLYPGEQVIAGKFGPATDVASPLQIPQDQVAVSVNLTDPARVAGFVNPGSQVAIYMTGTNPKSGESFAQNLLRNVTVIGVGSTTPAASVTGNSAPGAAATASDTAAGITEQLPRTLLTVALDPSDAQKVLFAQANGELSFALLPSGGDTQVKQGSATTFDNVFK